MNARTSTPLLFLALLQAATAFADAPPAPPAVVETAVPAKIAEHVSASEASPSSQGMLSLLNQISEMKGEIARLRGQLEELQHAQRLSEKRVKELFADLDERVKTLGKPQPAPVAAATTIRAEPAATPAPATRPTVTKPTPAVPAADLDAEGKAYELALGLLKEGKYVAAVNAFNEFVNAYPSASLVPNALYWLGLSQFSQGEFKAAIGTQQRLLKDYPGHAKAPDAMVSLARVHMQMGDQEAGKRWLDRVIAEHPTSKAADTARKMLELNK